MYHHFPEAEGRGQARSQKRKKNFGTTNIFKGDLGVQFVAPVIYLVWVYSNSQATWRYKKTQTVFLLGKLDEKENVTQIERERATKSS